MNVKEKLKYIDINYKYMFFNDVEVIPEKIYAIMINEVVPEKEKDDFYNNLNSQYLLDTILLFKKAGINVNSINEILNLGIYITNAVKIPKKEFIIQKSYIEKSIPYLEKELSLFPNIKVIMLMGDVAKKSFNIIAKNNTGKNIIPSISTYKLRKSQIYYNNIRLIPSYIMTGKNILIEKSKFEMASEDISIMYKIINQ